MKEQLQMEKHMNELQVKQMMTDMEQTLASTEQAQLKRMEMERAYKGIIEAMENQRAPDELTRLRGRQCFYCSHQLAFH